MTQEPIDLKLFMDVNDHFRKAADASNDKRGANSKPGSFTYFLFPVTPSNDYDEVYPGILLGNAKPVKEPESLKLWGVTHVVNCSMGPKFNQVNTDAYFYECYGISFHGIPAMDIATFKMSPHFRPAADFIDDALAKQGKVYVHCQQGVSRSASIVLAFLMCKRDMDLLSAAKLVRDKREIHPNEGFIKQLCRLSKEISDKAHSGSVSSHAGE